MWAKSSLIWIFETSPSEAQILAQEPVGVRGVVQTVPPPPDEHRISARWVRSADNLQNPQPKTTVRRGGTCGLCVG